MYQLSMAGLGEKFDGHSLTRENAIAYIDTIVRLNQTRAAEEMGVHRKTVENYKNRFAQMSAEERAFLITSLFNERWRELVRYRVMGFSPLGSDSDNTASLVMSAVIRNLVST